MNNGIFTSGKQKEELSGGGGRGSKEGSMGMGTLNVGGTPPPPPPVGWGPELSKREKRRTWVSTRTHFLCFLTVK